MAQFIMVINGVTSEQFEKIIAIQVKSQDKLRFIPQGNQQQGQVISHPLNSAGQPGQPATFNNVRIEWNETAAHFAREVFDLFTHHEKAAQA